jgi:hypothetical protein
MFGGHRVIGVALVESYRTDVVPSLTLASSHFELSKGNGSQVPWISYSVHIHSSGLLNLRLWGDFFGLHSFSTLSKRLF